MRAAWCSARFLMVHFSLSTRVFFRFSESREKFIQGINVTVFRRHARFIDTQSGFSRFADGLPIGGLVARPLELFGIDEGLQKHRSVAMMSFPIVADSPSNSG